MQSVTLGIKKDEAEFFDWDAVANYFSFAFPFGRTQIDWLAGAAAAAQENGD